MGFSATPGPVDLIGSTWIDEGTAPRAGMPLPGPEGLEAKPDDKKPEHDWGRVVRFAAGKMDEVIGDGECFTLVDQALRQAGAKSAADFGPVGKDVDYIWGLGVARAQVRPGDIVQFRDYVFEETVETGRGVSSYSQDRPHHSAIVEQVGENGIITVLEQNAPVGAGVGRSRLYFDSVSFVRDGATVTVKVSGKVVFYRPQAR